MTDYLISYQKPLNNEYASLDDEEIGIVEGRLRLLGGEVRRSKAGPSRTVLYRAGASVSLEMIQHTLRGSLDWNVGRACIAEVRPDTKVWAWPIGERKQSNSDWQSL